MTVMHRKNQRPQSPSSPSQLGVELDKWTALMITLINYSYLQRFCLIIALSFLCSCSESNGRGGPCEYQSYPGTAEFTELKPVTDGFEVYFDFTLSDPTATTKYLNNNGKNVRFATWDSTHEWIWVFTNEWLNSNGVSVGVTVPAEYHEIINYGSCVPADISFPTITGAHSF